MSDVGGPTVDPGRQPERTWLAWRRTTLAMTVASVLAVRLALGSGAVGVVVAVIWLIGWVGLMLLVRPWRSASRLPLAPRQALPLAVAVTVVQAGLGILLVLTALG